MIKGLSIFRAGAIGAVLALVSPVSGFSAEPANPECKITTARLDVPLTRTRAALAQGRPITIVAIGSSSTAGAGATSSAASYPSRLEAFLQARFRGYPIRVINRGINGEEEGDMIARFQRDVFAEKPDLILWQVGSNAVMRDRSMAMEEILIDTGIKRLQASGADVMLVDLQYTAAVLGKSETEPMLDLIASEGRANRVGVFHRFTLMKDWRVGRGVPFEAFSIADGLHMNDWGYNCFARNFAMAIGDAIAPPALAQAPATTIR